MFKVRPSFLPVIACLCIGAAFPVSAGAQTVNPLQLLSNLLSPKPSQLTKLIDEKKLDQADAFYGTERQFFTENSQSQADLLKRLALELNATYEPRLSSAEESLGKIDGAPPSAAKAAILEAQNLVREYGSLNIFSIQQYRTPRFDSLDAALKRTVGDLKANAAEAFVRFDHTGSANFFEDYPIQLDDSILDQSSAKLVTWVASLSASDIKNLRAKYPRQIGQNGPLLSAMSARFFSDTLAASPQPPSLATILGALKAAKESGFNTATVPGARIAFVEVTSKTLLREGQVEFPAQVELDLPFEATKVAVDDMLGLESRTVADYIIVLDVASARASRRITGKNDVDSRYVSGSHNEPNPAYDIARGRLSEAQAGLNNAQNTYAQGIAAAILKGVAIGAWSNRVNEAQAQLSGTSPMVNRDDYSTYKFSVSEVAASRNLTANYYVIDRNGSRYFKSTLDIADSKAFRISYNIHEKDLERGQILGRFDKESDIAAYEQAPMTLKVSALIEDYLKNQGQVQPLTSLSQLRDEMLVDKNKALVAYKSKQFDAKPVNDDRFDSVVVILNPAGGAGAGFYISPDVVITNFHVIEGAKFVEMRLYNGLETFGKVVKSDVRLDLALVKVQTRGRPLSLFESQTLELGATVEAIGHPKGLTFTLTRGVISAVRKRQSIYGVGGKDVLFVQTDAAINPGNSGGPLLLGTKVIGVNNNKLVRNAEGLGFAVHYSELQEFLKESF